MQTVYKSFDRAQRQNALAAEITADKHERAQSDMVKLMEKLINDNSNTQAVMRSLLTNAPQLALAVASDTVLNLAEASPADQGDAPGGDGAEAMAAVSTLTEQLESTAKRGRNEEGGAGDTVQEEELAAREDELARATESARLAGMAARSAMDVDQGAPVGWNSGSTLDGRTSRGYYSYNGSTLHGRQLSRSGGARGEGEDDYYFGATDWITRAAMCWLIMQAVVRVRRLHRMLGRGYASVHKARRKKRLEVSQVGKGMAMGTSVVGLLLTTIAFMSLIFHIATPVRAAAHTANLVVVVANGEGGIGKWLVRGAATAKFGNVDRGTTFAQTSRNLDLAAGNLRRPSVRRYAFHASYVWESGLPVDIRQLDDRDWTAPGVWRRLASRGTVGRAGRGCKRSRARWDDWEVQGDAVLLPPTLRDAWRRGPEVDDRSVAGGSRPERGGGGRVGVLGGGEIDPCLPSHDSPSQIHTAATVGAARSRAWLASQDSGLGARAGGPVRGGQGQVDAGGLRQAARGGAVGGDRSGGGDDLVHLQGGVWVRRRCDRCVVTEGVSGQQFMRHVESSWTRLDDAATRAVVNNDGEFLGYLTEQYVGREASYKFGFNDWMRGGLQPQLEGGLEVCWAHMNCGGERLQGPPEPWEGDRLYVDVTVQLCEDLDSLRLREALAECCKHSTMVRYRWRYGWSPFGPVKQEFAARTRGRPIAVLSRSGTIRSAPKRRELPRDAGNGASTIIGECSLGRRRLSDAWWRGGGQERGSVHRYRRRGLCRPGPRRGVEGVGRAGMERSGGRNRRRNDDGCSTQWESSDCSLQEGATAHSDRRGGRGREEVGWAVYAGGMLDCGLFDDRDRDEMRITV